MIFRMFFIVLSLPLFAGSPTEKVIVRELKKEIRTVGIVEADERKISDVQVKFNGWIEKLFINFTGEMVHRGDPLFSIYSPDLLTAQEEFLLSLSAVHSPTTDRFRDEWRKINEKLLEASRRKLELLDVSPQEIAKLEKIKKASKVVKMISPVTGIVLKKEAFAGMQVEPGMTLFTIADLFSIWIVADIYEKEIELIKDGKKAQISLISIPGEVFLGHISFVYPTVNSITRTMKARFDFKNPKLKLKPGMYATVRIKINLGKALSVPESAVIITGERKIVFVKTSHGHFEQREVEVGRKAGSYYEVISGLKQGEEVATNSQFLIDSESRLSESKHVHGGE